MIFNPQYIQFHMKKYFFVAVAALTQGLASCSENAKTDNTDATFEEEMKDAANKALNLSVFNRFY